MEKVCCMCGDVGFSDKLFRCAHCLNRFQHSYCSNYYSESAEPTETCDWCRSDDRKLSSVNARHVSSKSKPSSSSSSSSKTLPGAPSPRTATPRYKLLKDVMC